MKIEDENRKLKSEVNDLKEQLQSYIPRRRVRRVYKQLRKILEQDIENDSAIYISQQLAEEHAHLIITDPKALDNAKNDLRNVDGKIDYIADPYDAASGCDAIAVMTGWRIYTELDYEKIWHSMVKPAFIFDGRNILDHHALFKLGFNVYPIGKPALTHFR